MLFEIVLALIVGVAAGTITGIFPGIHINLVSAFLLAYIGFFSGIGIAPIVLSVFIVAMAITHTFVDFVPSVFLGAPEEDTFLSVLPGHQLLRQGRGHEAVVFTLYGSLAALPIILIFTFVFVYLLEDVYNFSKFFIPYILIFVSLYLVFRDEEVVNAFVVFILAGFVGLFAFNLPVREPLLPLLSGLFGVSGLIVSLKNRVVIPKQKIKKLREIRLFGGGLLRGSIAAAVAAPLCSFLPGIGSGHAAVLGSEISGKFSDNKKYFLFLVGAINTVVMALSFVTAYVIGKTRTGAAVAVQEILGEISSSQLFVLMIAVVFSGILAFSVGINLSKFFSRNISKFNYAHINLVILGILFFVTLGLSNWRGIIVLITASALGVFTILSKVRRINLMGSLLIPTIVYYIFM